MLDLILSILEVLVLLTIVGLLVIGVLIIIVIVAELLGIDLDDAPSMSFGICAKCGKRADRISIRISAFNYEDLCKDCYSPHPANSSFKHYCLKNGIYRISLPDDAK